MSKFDQRPPEALMGPPGGGGAPPGPPSLMSVNTGTQIFSLMSFCKLLVPFVQEVFFYIVIHCIKVDKLNPSTK